jgi:hypothetical protein
VPAWREVGTESKGYESRKQFHVRKAFRQQVLVKREFTSKVPRWLH